jgi:hypothetical protein
MEPVFSRGPGERGACRQAENPNSRVAVGLPTPDGAEGVNVDDADVEAVRC